MLWDASQSVVYADVKLYEKQWDVKHLFCLQLHSNTLALIGKIQNFKK